MQLHRTYWLTLAIAISLLGARVWLADSFPLTDTTEARYSEISRLMAETSDWITPQHDYGQPFWAKPPLTFWAVAAGIDMAGTSELSVRLPILLATIFFLAFLYYWTQQELGHIGSATYVLALLSSAGFYICSAAVMTDMLMTISISIALLSFWNSYFRGRRHWSWAFFACLGLGVLTKGPLAAFLTLTPIGIWSILNGNTARVWQRIAWIRGGSFALLIATPWYLLAELKTPGFLDYFIVGENLSRLTQSEWTGDLYGRVHDQTIGTIWLYFAAGTMPALVVYLPLLALRWRQLVINWHQRRDLITFGLCWALTPLLLFTFAPNIIFPYALPAIPGAVLACVACLLKPEGEDQGLLRLSWISGSITLLCFTVAAYVLLSDEAWISNHSQRPIIAKLAANPSTENCETYYWEKRVFSGEFYTEGQAETLSDAAALRKRLAQTGSFCLIATRKRLRHLPEKLRLQFEPVFEIGRNIVLQRDN